MSKRYQLAVYERVSTNDQDYTSQHVAITEWMIDNGYDPSSKSILWYREKASGKSLSRRQIERLGRDIQSGRVTHAVFFSLDRFAREMLAGLNQIDEWSKTGCRLTFVADSIDVQGLMTDVMLKCFLALRLAWAEAERERIRLRVLLGQKRARENGVKFGRPKMVKNDRIRDLAAKGWDKQRISKKCRVSLSSVYRALRTD